MGSISTHKPHVVCLGTPQHAGANYISEFIRSFTFSILEACNRTEAVAKLPDLIASKGPVDAFIIRMGTPPYEPFDAEFLSLLGPTCRLVVSASAGYNEFPIDWLSENKILFCNSVDAVAEATADMAVWLLLSTLRNTSRAERSARAGTWRSVGGLIPARDPAGLTLGIVGLGAIGKYLAQKAAVFGLAVKYHNRTRLNDDEERKYNAIYCSSMEELLSTSDIVSINCPLNAATTNLISTAEFEAMKQGSFFINTARGAIVDENALKGALESGKIARAGLDVLCNEPNVDPWFLDRDDVIVQPHLGGLTDVAFMKAERECFENIKAFFETGKANSPVNTKEVSKA